MKECSPYCRVCQNISHVKMGDDSLTGDSVQLCLYIQSNKRDENVGALKTQQGCGTGNNSYEPEQKSATHELQDNGEFPEPGTKQRLEFTASFNQLVG